MSIKRLGDVKDDLISIQEGLINLSNDVCVLSISKNSKGEVLRNIKTAEEFIGTAINLLSDEKEYDKDLVYLFDISVYAGDNEKTIANRAKEAYKAWLAYQ
jgi:hypothetical protein